MTEQKINDGGTAFPSEQGTDHHGQWNQTFERGMSLRDWLAGQALVGLLANPRAMSVIDDIADTALAIADAVIAKRNL